MIDITISRLPPFSFPVLLSSPLIHVLPQILLPFTVIFALSLPPFQSRGIIGSGLILGVVYLCFLSPWPHETQMRYGILNSWFYWVPVVQKLVCAGGVEERYWRVKHDADTSPAVGLVVIDGKEEGRATGYVKGGLGRKRLKKEMAVGKGKEKEAMYMRGLSWEKVVWAGELFTNPRGVGWNFRTKSTIARPAPYRNDQRSRFLVAHFFHFILRYLVVDTGTVFLGGYDANADSGVLGKIVSTLTWGVMVRCNWEMMWLFTSLVTVGLGISSPENWPPLFGRWSDCTSVGGFWGKYWQGILRQSLLGFSTFLIRILTIPNHTAWSYLTHLTTGFFISGFFHALVLSNLPVNPPIPTRELWTQNLSYFLIQIVPIAIENFFESLVDVLELRFEVKVDDGEDTGSRVWRTMKMGMGILWTVTWLVWTGWPYLGVYMRSGMGDWKLPFSVWGWVMEQYSRGTLGWFG